MTVKKRIASLKALKPQYLLLDAALCPEPLWFAKGAGIKCDSLFKETDRELEDNGPWLIELSDQDDIFRLTIEKDPLGHGSMWLLSNDTSESLIHALRARIYVELENDHTTRFRFYDPRVLHHYLLAEESKKRTRFLSPASQWVYAQLNPFYFEQHWHSWYKQEGRYQCQALPIHSVNHQKEI